jgi:anti-sigma regulatory factor (Ser/Thr protein kinase)
MDVRKKVMDSTGEQMTLDLLIHEMVKNIYDHADGKGGLRIFQENGAYQFEVWDAGQEAHVFAERQEKSTKSGNGVNYGAGLSIIIDGARALNIQLTIQTEKGFSYSGVYTPQGL